MSEIIEVSVDRTLCEGYGNCVLAAEDVFDLNDDGQAVAVKSAVDDGRLADIKRAVYDCPMEAISFGQRAG